MQFSSFVLVYYNDNYCFVSNNYTELIMCQISNPHVNDGSNGLGAIRNIPHLDVLFLLRF